MAPPAGAGVNCPGLYTRGKIIAETALATQERRYTCVYPHMGYDQKNPICVLSTPGDKLPGTGTPAAESLLRAVEAARREED